MRVTTYTPADINKSHDVSSSVQLLGRSTTVPVKSGSVTVDGTAAVRRRAKITVVGYHPEIDPFGSELKIFRSYNTEQVQLGLFRVEDPTFDEDEHGITTSFDCYDRSYWLQSLELPTPYTVTDNTRLDLAIKALLQWRAPSITFDFDPSPHYVAGVTLEEGDDPWAKSLDMADSGGMELFFDVDGVCRLRRPAAADLANVVQTFGDEARILKASKKQSTKGTRSHAIVIGENPNVSTPIRSDKYDDNPSSPTYYLGSFGDRIVRLHSQFITTQGQADEACEALLARRAGRSETVHISGIPNPAMDANDVIRILRPSIDLDAVCVVDKLEIPLEVDGEMDIDTRERQVA